jgi:hypothetical protein
MIGGADLCYEGAEKIWHRVSGHEEHHASVQQAMPDEKTIVSGAVRTDFILSAEIMVISLNEVASEAFVSRAVILAVVAIGITVLVYGVVGLIVKMDDVGLSLSQRPGKRISRFGHGLVKAMPRLLSALTVIGTVAMLWVGGHIILVGSDELGLHAIYGAVHHVEELAHDATGALGGVVGWLVNTLFSALLGLIIGAIIVLVMSLTLHRRKGSHAEDDAHTEDAAQAAHADTTAKGADVPATEPATDAASPGSGATKYDEDAEKH